ncbi:MAG: hypothetical protein VXY92_06155, partial [Planctomycetota bacterium]|nr:hypothetical protein [Planctomycetota bacterium]
TMAKHLFTFPCPCCDKMVEVDTRSGKARAVRADEQRGGQNLDDLFAAQKHESQRLDDLFSSAKDTESRQEDEREQKLQRAKDEAKKSPDEKPHNPFDLD